MAKFQPECRINSRLQFINIHGSWRMFLMALTVSIGSCWAYQESIMVITSSIPSFMPISISHSDSDRVSYLRVAFYCSRVFWWWQMKPRGIHSASVGWQGSGKPSGGADLLAMVARGEEWPGLEPTLWLSLWKSAYSSFRYSFKCSSMACRRLCLHSIGPISTS